jgi:uncharacterized iron-regulated membrane protein
MRPLFVLIHRYLGLVLAGFLVITGLTGALLAFEHDLDAALNPGLMHVKPPASGATAMDALALREIVLARYPGARSNRVEFATRPDEPVVFRLEWPATLQGRDDQVFVDPYTGQILGARRWGDIAQGVHNLSTFAWRLHQSLAWGKPGAYVLGFIALAWTLDCFVGAYLTLPARRKRQAVVSHNEHGWKAWLARWRPAWQVRWKGGSHKLNFDLHRAGGLWLWLMLLMMAWSAVGFNLREIYRPVMDSVFEMQPSVLALPKAPVKQPEAGLGWSEARAIGRTLMAQQARTEGFVVQEELSLSYDAAKVLYRYRVRSDRDIRDENGSTSIWFDGNSGQLKAVFLPTGAATGDTVTTWLYALHMASVGGVPYKIVVVLLGLAVMMLSITGVVIWRKKHVARRSVRS